MLVLCYGVYRRQVANSPCARSAYAVCSGSTDITKHPGGTVDQFGGLGARTTPASTDGGHLDRDARRFTRRVIGVSRICFRCLLDLRFAESWSLRMNDGITAIVPALGLALDQAACLDSLTSLKLLDVMADEAPARSGYCRHGRIGRGRQLCCHTSISRACYYRWRYQFLDADIWAVHHPTDYTFSVATRCRDAGHV